VGREIGGMEEEDKRREIWEKKKPEREEGEDFRGLDVERKEDELKGDS